MILTKTTRRPNANLDTTVHQVVTSQFLAQLDSSVQTNLVWTLIVVVCAQLVLTATLLEPTLQPLVSQVISAPRVQITPNHVHVGRTIRVQAFTIQEGAHRVMQAGIVHSWAKTRSMLSTFVMLVTTVLRGPLGLNQLIQSQDHVVQLEVTASKVLRHPKLAILESMVPTKVPSPQPIVSTVNQVSIAWEKTLQMLQVSAKLATIALEVRLITTQIPSLESTPMQVLPSQATTPPKVHLSRLSVLKVSTLVMRVVPSVIAAVLVSSVTSWERPRRSLT